MVAISNQWLLDKRPSRGNKVENCVCITVTQVEGDYSEESLVVMLYDGSQQKKVSYKIQKKAKKAKLW